MREDRIKEEYRDEEKASLVMGLKEKLNWYTMRASDEEYDEKAVESILYLLDQLEPLDKNEMPAADEAWGRFQDLLRERGVWNRGIWGFGAAQSVEKDRKIWGTGSAGEGGHGERTRRQGRRGEVRRRKAYKKWEDSQKVFSSSAGKADRRSAAL